MSQEIRSQLLSFYREALGAVDGATAVRRVLAQAPAGDAWSIVAVGKAAASMTLGALQTPGLILRRGLVITRHGHLAQVPALRAECRLTCIESDHPLPGAASLEAGRALTAFLDAEPDAAHLLFLISGGTSSLVECLVPGVTREDLHALNRCLLAAGVDIHTVNAVRRRMSRIKGGGLCAWLRGRPTLALYVSDVRDDDPAVIGSGLLCATPAGPLPASAARVLDDLPQQLRGVLLATVRPRADCGTVRHQIAAGLDDAMVAAAAAARRAGLAVFMHRERLAGEAEAIGRNIALRLQSAADGLHIWGGETTVTLPTHPGRGGRNQHLALAAARILDRVPGIVLLAAGTDGSDGNSDDAGGLIDGGTIARGEAEGLSAEACLMHADSGRFLAAAGDLVHTGPTGTNVTDLVMALKLPAKR